MTGATAFGACVGASGHVCGLDAATAAFPYAVWGYAHQRAAPVELCAESCPPAGPFTSRRALALAVTF